VNSNLFNQPPDQFKTVWVGSNAYPDNWKDILSYFGIEYDEEDEEGKRPFI
jgi:hypothetical protein